MSPASPTPGPEGHRTTRGARALDRRLLCFIVTLSALTILNDALPYFGLRDDSCQTMFSGLDCQERSNNHLFLPQRALSDLWAYHDDVRVTVEPAPEPGSVHAYLVTWLAQDERRLNTEATRVVVRQLCDAGHAVRLSVRGSPFEDACASPRLSSPARWIPVRLYETDYEAGRL